MSLHKNRFKGHVVKHVRAHGYCLYINAEVNVMPGGRSFYKSDENKRSYVLQLLWLIVRQWIKGALIACVWHKEELFSYNAGAEMVS